MRSTTRPRTAAHLAAIIALVVLVSGCSPAEPLISAEPTASSSAAPFASDDEALAAARVVYEGYLKATDEVISDGGVNPDRVEEFVTAGLAATEQEGFEDFRARNVHSTGNSRLAGFTQQSYRPNAPRGVGIVTAYTCVDITDIDVLDLNGDSIVSADRPNQTAFEVSFDMDLSTTGKLRVSSTQPWEGDEVC
jgi:hypothetical protein